MSVGAFLRFAQRALGLRRTQEPELFRLLRERPAVRIVQLGIDSLDEATELVRKAVAASPSDRVHYTAFDWFDERPEGLPRLSLRETHRDLVRTGAAVRLCPGGPVSALRGEANSLARTDLLLFSRLVDERLFDPLWFYVPRMCVPTTRVLWRGDAPASDAEKPSGEPEWRTVSLDEVNRRAGAVVLRRAA